MKYFILFVTGLLLFGCVEKSQNKITNPKDYAGYLTTATPKTSSKYFELWHSKIKPDSMQLLSFGVVGGEYSRYFESTGAIEYLKMAEQSLKKAVDIAAIGKAGYYRALARNYISQHRFKEALQLADSADAIGSGKQQTQALYFDVHMELGNYQKAEIYLDSTKNMSDFGYLIRLSKWNDYKGDLDTTIKFMEIAKNKAEASKNKDLMLWSYTNLADYYGHAGRIEDSYQHYLKSLELDPQNAYAKKGIAWIVFSYEKNAKEALRIVDSVTKNYQAPDFFLLKSEIAAFIGDEQESITNIDHYFIALDNPAYGVMYNAHNIALYLGRSEQFSKALELAKDEVNNRATPASYCLLAYAYLKNGEKEKALELVEKYVDGKTFEPGMLYYTAEIFKANNKADKVSELKNELLGAVYELGPASHTSITQL